MFPCSHWDVNGLRPFPSDFSDSPSRWAFGSEPISPLRITPCSLQCLGWMPTQMMRTCRLKGTCCHLLEDGGWLTFYLFQGVFLMPASSYKDGSPSPSVSGIELIFLFFSVAALAGAFWQALAGWGNSCLGSSQRGQLCLESVLQEQPSPRHCWSKFSFTQTSLSLSLLTFPSNLLPQISPGLINMCM